MVILGRDEGGTPTVWCDPCIAPLVSALNAAGLHTVASCCGHDYHPGRVMLRDGRHLFIATPEWEERISGFVHDLVGCKPGFECLNCATMVRSSPRVTS